MALPPPKGGAAPAAPAGPVAAGGRSAPVPAAPANQPMATAAAAPSAASTPPPKAFPVSTPAATASADGYCCSSAIGSFNTASEGLSGLNTSGDCVCAGRFSRIGRMNGTAGAGDPVKIPIGRVTSAGTTVPYWRSNDDDDDRDYWLARGWRDY
eukprot:s519_g19.t1